MAVQAVLDVGDVAVLVVLDVNDADVDSILDIVDVVAIPDLIVNHLSLLHLNGSVAAVVDSVAAVVVVVVVDLVAQKQLDRPDEVDLHFFQRIDILRK